LDQRARQAAALLGDLRQEITLPYLGHQGPDMLVQHGAVAADQKRFRRTVDPPVDRNLPVRIESRSDIRIAELREPAERGRALVLPVEPVDRDAARARELEQIGVLFPAADAPRRPDVQERHLAGEIAAADLTAG